MTIRPATNDDLSQLSVLKRPKDEQHRLGYEQSAQKKITLSQENRSLFLIIEDNHKILGQVFLRLDGNETEPGYPNMQDLFIAEGYRNQGLGKQLILECEHVVKEKGYAKVSVAVNPTLNPRAQFLYERLGYRNIGNETYLDGVYDGDEDWVIDLAKELD